MWFLWFYLISIAACALILLIFAVAAGKKIKREYPNLKTKKNSFAEVLVAFMPYLIPFINLILLILLMLQSQKIVDESIKKIKEQSLGDIENEEI